MPAAPSPRNATTPGRPFTRPSRTCAAHVAPVCIAPMKVTVPWQDAAPASSPRATKLIGPVDGVLVTPGRILNVPVASAGVPPHVQIVVPDRAEVAAVLVGADIKNRMALVAATTTARALMGCSPGRPRVTHHKPI